MISIRNAARLSAIVCIALVSACATKGGLYQRAKMISDLEMPPDLTKPVEDTAYEIPGFNTLVASEISLSDGDSVRLIREGGVRYLQFRADGPRLWQRVRQFWLDRDVAIEWESPGLGVMETEWAKNRQGRFALDKFRVRIEPGAKPGTYNLFLTHRGIQQVFAHGEYINTWGPRTSDTELEAEIIGYLLEYLSLDKARARQIVEQAAAAAAADNVKLDRENGALVINEPMEQAWVRIGLAMEREGFVIVDSARDKGVYHLRGRSAEMKDKREDQAFKDMRPSRTQQAFGLKVTADGDKTRVTILDSGDKADTSSFALEMLARLQGQLL